MWASFQPRPRSYRHLRFGLAISAVALIVIGVAVAWLLSAPHPAVSGKAALGLEAGGDAARGQLVFTAADCASCHASPGQGNRLRLGGGLALASPFGTLRVPNISPDLRDGIGRWRTADLANALLSGVSPAGEHYYPALPYTSYAHMSLGDVRDLMAYLRTLPKVAGRPPSHDVPFPFSIRRLIGLWKVLYFDRSALQPEPGRAQQWNRGRYLVEAVAHCAECHSARNVLGGIRGASRFAGGENPEGIGFAPNITPGAIGAWSRADLITFLRAGQTPDLRIVGSSMADVLGNTARLPQTDLEAMASYLVTLPARSTSQP